MNTASSALRSCLVDPSRPRQSQLARNVNFAEVVQVQNTVLVEPETTDIIITHEALKDSDSLSSPVLQALKARYHCPQPLVYFNPIVQVKTTETEIFTPSSANQPRIIVSSSEPENLDLKEEIPASAGASAMPDFKNLTDLLNSFFTPREEINLSFFDISRRVVTETNRAQHLRLAESMLPQEGKTSFFIKIASAFVREQKLTKTHTTLHYRLTMHHFTELCECKFLGITLKDLTVDSIESLRNQVLLDVTNENLTRFTEQLRDFLEKLSILRLVLNQE